MRRSSPIQELTSGLIAGVAGSFAQTLFFTATKSIAPASRPKGPIEMPEAEQSQESPTETVARRTVEGLAQRPLRHKARGGRLVHYAFGSAWGGAYGLIAGSREPDSIVAAGGAFGLIVWAAGDNLLLPLFKLSGWPQRYPVRLHAYAATAHLVYGVTVAVVHSALHESAASHPIALWKAARITRRALRPGLRQLTRQRWHVARALRRARAARQQQLAA